LVGYYYAGPTASTQGLANWGLRSAHPTLDAAYHEGEARAARERGMWVTVSFPAGPLTARDRKTWDAAWLSRWMQQALQAYQDAGVLHSVYLADEPSNYGISTDEVSSRAAAVRSQGFKTMAVSYAGQPRPGGLDYWGFSCYHGSYNGWAFDAQRCGDYTRYYRPNVVVAQSFYGGPPNRPDEFGLSMPDQFGWHRLAVEVNAEVLAYWAWPSFAPYVGAVDSPEAQAQQRAIAAAEGVTP
jgi:hypothetical protein